MLTKKDWSILTFGQKCIYDQKCTGKKPHKIKRRSNANNEKEQPKTRNKMPKSIKYIISALREQKYCNECPCTYKMYVIPNYGGILGYKYAGYCTVIYYSIREDNKVVDQ